MMSSKQHRCSLKTKTQFIDSFYESQHLGSPDTNIEVAIARQVIFNAISYTSTKYDFSCQLVYIIT